MRPIGGYFELELPSGGDYHRNVLQFNSARNALVGLVRAKRLSAIQLPVLNCPVVAEALTRFCPDTEISYYHLDQDLAPIQSQVSARWPLYYVNYFGIHAPIFDRLSGFHLIVDNAQAFYQPPLVAGDTLYCPRKFFGTADGGYLATNPLPQIPLEPDTSWDHSGHLLRRIDEGAQSGYRGFKEAEEILICRPPMGISALTQRILRSIDHRRVKDTRRENFLRLHRDLAAQNKWTAKIDQALQSEDFVPFFYPFAHDGACALRKALIADQIFIPVFWPDIPDSLQANATEKAFTSDILAIPIDQRYGIQEMVEILTRMRHTQP